MARGRGLVRERNGDGSYTYAKRTANGLVYISNAEYNRLMRKRAADDGAEDSQRLKRTKSLLPDPAKPVRMPGQLSNGKHVKDLLSPDLYRELSSAVLEGRNAVVAEAKTLGASEDTVNSLSTGELQSWIESQRNKTKGDEVEVTEDKKLKATPAKDGTLHLTDDDGEKLKEVRRVYDLKIADLESDVEFWTTTSNTVEKEKDALEAKVKELEASLANRSNTHEKEKDALKAKIEELEATHAHNWQALNDRDEDLDALWAANEHNDKTFKILQERAKKIQEENTRLRAYLKRLNPQEEPVDATKIVNGQLVFLSEAEIDGIDRRERQRFNDVLRHNYEAQKQKEALKQKDRNNEDESEEA